MSNNIILKNSQFLSIIRKHDVETAEEYCKLLQLAFGEFSNYWEEIGFKYISVLPKIGEKTELFDSHPWISEIMMGIHDTFNGVAESIEKGIHVFDSIIRTTFSNRVDKNFLLDAIVDYLDNYISNYDLDYFQSLYLKKNNDYYPINHRGSWSIGIINPWPGSMSAESEVLSRMRVGCADAGVKMTMLSNYGHVLNPDTQEQTENYVNPEDLDFVISTHYDSHKSVDSFYYHTLWNPPEIPLNLVDYSGRVTDNYLMNEDYLIYDNGGMSNHLRCILMNKPRDISDASSLTASFPKSRILEPKLEDPKMFYCGMNWECVVNKSNRHEGLFKLLDKTEKVKFFGPEKNEAWGGIRPWEGYQCYQYSIPFDGFSILEEINDCGICLVLSSDIHRRAGSATNRTYEACAAGAVIISDDNPFMLKYFKDAALFIRYNKNDPQDTFNQLMEKYQWIISHKDEALKIAKRAQEVFLEKFALDYQIRNIVSNHTKRLEITKKYLFAHNEEKTVLATFVLNTQDIDSAKRLLKPVIENIRRQYYRNIELAVAADISIVCEVEQYCKRELYAVDVIPLSLFDFKSSRRMTDAEALDDIYQKIEHSYFINMRSEEVWFKDHISTLVRAIEDTKLPFSYSGRLFEDGLGYRRTDMFRKLGISTIYYMTCPDWFPVPGQILFSYDCHSCIPTFMLPYIDGMEHYALMTALVLKEKKTGEFTRRMSLNYIDGKWDNRSAVVPDEMQIRVIRDSVKYSLPDSFSINNSGNNLNTVEMMQKLAVFPTKKWLSIRIAAIRLRHLSPKGKRYKRVVERFMKEFNEFAVYYNK